MADVIVAEGFYDVADLADTSDNERTQLFKRLADGKAGRARALRKILDSKKLATEIGAKKTPAYKEIDISAAIKSRKHPSGLAEILILTRQRTSAPKSATENERFPHTRPLCSRSLTKLHGPRKTQITNGPAKTKSFGNSEMARRLSS